MTKPLELTRAEILDQLCRAYGQPPSVMLAEDAYTLLQLRSTLDEG